MCPFKSEAQRRYFHRNLPHLVEEWEKHTSSKKLPKKKKQTSSAKEKKMSKIKEKTKKTSNKTKKNKMVTIGKGIKIPRGREAKLEKRPGGSNVGKYKKVAKKDFAGPSGGAPIGSFPINTLKRARAALAYAHNAPSPAGIRRKVYAKYPSLKAKKKSTKQNVIYKINI